MTLVMNLSEEGPEWKKGLERAALPYRKVGKAFCKMLSPVKEEVRRCAACGSVGTHHACLPVSSSSWAAIEHVEGARPVHRGSTVELMKECWNDLLGLRVSGIAGS